MFDHADDKVMRLRALGRKDCWWPGGTRCCEPGLRVGLGANELRHLQRVDFAVNPKASQFGPFGVLAVRHGKAMRASTRNGAAS